MPSTNDSKNEHKRLQWSTDVKGLEEETSCILQKYGKTKNKSRFGTSSSTCRGTRYSCSFKEPSIQSRRCSSGGRISVSSSNSVKDEEFKRNSTIDIAAKTIQRFFRTRLNLKNVNNDEKFQLRPPITLSEHRFLSNDNVREDSFGNVDHHPRLFKEDGSAKLTLRAAIADALKTHRFDNVPAILLHDNFNRPPDDAMKNEDNIFQSESNHVAGQNTLNYPKHLFCANDKKLVSNVTFDKVQENRKLFTPKYNGKDQEDTLSLRDIHYPGFESNSNRQAFTPTNSNGALRSDSDLNERQQRGICFNCWSAGNSSTQCKLYQNKSSKKANVQICGMWGIRFLRQCYRCEDIERESPTDLSALRFVKDSRRRSAIAEHESHPIFKSLSKHIETVNLRARRRFHIKQWFKSFINNLKLNITEGANCTASAKILRDKGTKSNIFTIRSLFHQLYDSLPSAPITETEISTDASIIGKKKVLTNQGMVEKKLILPRPFSVPVALYSPRVYDAPQTVTLKLNGLNNDVDCYASFGKKRTPNNMAVGGFSGEVVLMQRVQKYFPPQYGNYTIEDTSISVPDTTPETYVPPDTIIIEPKKLDYVERELQHVLNTRRVPTITIKVGLDPDEKNYYGLNRPEQTGEIEYCGFRTSESSELPCLNSRINTSTFVPSCDVSSPNTPKQLPPITTKADLNYPFCDTDSRQNSIEDLVYILDAAQPCTANKPQTFTAMTLQEPGKFMRNYDQSLPLGRLRTVVTRSWTFLQKRRIAKFMTRNGAPYWYDRRAGQTYWERPLCDEEMIPLKEGGVVLGSRKNNFSDETIDYNNPLKSRPVMRKIILSQQDNIKANVLNGSPTSVECRKMLSNANSYENQSGDQQKNSPIKTEDERSTKTESDGEDIAETSFGADSPSSRPKIISEERSIADIEQEKEIDNNLNEASIEERRVGSTNPTIFDEKEEVEVEDRGEDLDVNETLTYSKKGYDDKTSSKLVSSITNILGGMLKDLSNEEDILKLGVGLGMSLGAQGILTMEKDDCNNSLPKELILPNANSPSSAVTMEQKDIEESQYFPYPEENVEERDNNLERSCDEEKSHEPLEKESNLKLPLKNSYVVHKVTELGILPEQNDTVKNKLTLQTLSDPVPRGFLNAISSRRVGKQHVDYIPSSPNLPQCRPVGRVKPRSAGKDWLAIGFDPWSTGKELLNIEFVPFLVGSEEESNLIPLSAPNNSVPYGKRVNTSENELLQTKFRQLCSCIRHGNYTEFDQLLEDCGDTIPIDHTDDVGNTLLMVSCQNGNKRIVKLCLRKGSDVNKQNTNGHTCLHYAFGYGFHELGAYLISKGADDSILNADGLTCYEGLRIEDISSL